MESQEGAHKIRSGHSLEEGAVLLMSAKPRFS